MPAVPTTAKASCRINGVDLRTFGIELTAYPNILLPPVRTRYQTIPGRHGVRDHGSLYEPLSFDLNAQIRATDHDDFVSKFSQFKRHIDIVQQKVSEWITGNRSVKQLRFELAGHRYYYETGTVDVTNGSRTVTKNSGSVATNWKSYAKPGSEFIVQGDTTRYVVASVDSNTQLTLTATVSRATGTVLTYQLERRRFLDVSYNGTSEISAISHAYFKDTVFNVRIGFTSPYPFWIADDFLQEITTLDGSTVFTELLGTGNAPSNPVYRLIDGPSATSTHKICSARYSFTSKFDGNTTARDILNDSDKTPTLTRNIIYKAAKVGGLTGAAMGGNTIGSQADSFTFPSMQDGTAPTGSVSDRINYEQFTLVFWVNTNWAWNDGKTHYLLYSQQSASNRINVYKNTSNKLVIEYNDVVASTDGTNNSANSYDVSSYVAGRWYLIAVKGAARRVVDGSNYIEAFMSNAAGTSISQVAYGTVNPADPTTAATTNYVGTDSSSQNSIDGIIDDFGIWDIDLTDAQITTTLWNSGNGARADTVESAHLLTYIPLDGTDSSAVASTAQGSCNVNALTLSSYSTPTVTFAAAQTYAEVSSVFAANDRVILWSSGGTAVLQDTISAVNNVSPVTITLTTGGAWVSSGTLYISKNLMADGDMELSGTDYWTAGDGATTLGKNTTNIKFGVRSLSITNGDGTQAYARKTLTTVAGEDYIFHGWFRSPATPNGASQLVDVDATVALGITVTQAGATSANTWYEIEFCFEAADASTTVDLGSGSVTNTEVGYWDNVSVLPSLVADGDMEDTLTDSWTQEASATMAADTSEHAGAQEMKITAAAANVGAKQNVTLVNGKHYEVVGYVRATSGDSATIIMDKGDTVTQTIGTTTSTSYTRISGIFKATGTAGVIYLRAVNNTDIVWFDDVFVKHRPDIDATLTAMAAGYHYLPTRNDKGIYIRAGTTLSYSSLVGYKSEFGFLVRLRPQFPSTASSTGEDKTIFLHRAGASDYYELFYDWSAAVWTFRKNNTADGAVDTTSAVQQFSSNDEIELAGSFDATNGMKLYVNGIQDDSDTGATAKTAIASNPSTLYVGGNASGIQQAESIVDELVLFVKAPTANDVKGWFADGEPLINYNATLVYTGSITDGDIVEIDLASQTYKLYDASAASESNVGSSVSGSDASFEGYDDEKQILYVPNAVDRLQIEYLPHWR